MAYIKLLAFLAIVALARTQQVDNYYGDQSNALIRNDDYIDSVRRQNAANIWYYNLQIESFKEAYLQRIATIETQKDSLLNELIRTDESLYPLTLLSDFSKECVHKYKSLIPSLTAAKSEMDRCISAGSNQAASIVSTVSSTNRTLETYYRVTFEKEISNCQTKFNSSVPTNYTMCLASAVAVCNAYTLNNQKSFSSQMETAKNSGSAYVKIAQECSFAVQNSTVTNISRASTLIDRCLHGQDDCDRCSGHFCQSVYQIPESLIDPKNGTMINPFYGRNETGNCLMLDITSGSGFNNTELNVPKK